MTVYVFTGPTLAASDARAVLDVVYLPPVAQGDLYRVARERPAAIGIIDGYFDTLPAVWHKEILWAMHEGVAVYGSASMGALRAAELAAFGMRGVGAIFEAYRAGELEDDDEVALVHDSEASGYRALSVPMVNLRATLAAAASAGVITETTRDALIAGAKLLFYPDRSYPRVLEDPALDATSRRALAAWLRLGQVDAKRADALAMLRAMKEHLAEPRQEKARFHFEHTTYWEALRRSDDGRAPAATGPLRAVLASRELLDELRLDRGAFDAARARVLHRALSRALGEREGQRIDGERLERAVERFRHGRGLLEAGTLEAWMGAHELDAASFSRLMEDEAFGVWAAAWGAPDLERRLLEELKLGESYEELRSRARDKDAVLARAGMSEPSPRDARMESAELVRWYFGELAREPVPQDLRQYALDAGFADEQLFLRAVLREFLYRQRASAAGSSQSYQSSSVDEKGEQR